MRLMALVSFQYQGTEARLPDQRVLMRLMALGAF